MTTSRRMKRTVLHGEELETVLRELDEFTVNEANRIRGNEPRNAATALGVDQDAVSASLNEALRAAVEDEVVPAVVPEGAGILAHEYEHELVKKALAALKSDALRMVARKRELETAGSLEALATRIAESYRWDKEAIARLILEHETEPSEERGHLDRFFPLVDEPDLNYIATRLDYVLGRYIRTGIARWFVFEDLDQTEDQVTLGGTLRSFRTEIGDQTESPTVVAVPAADHTVTITIGRSPLLRVRGGNAPQATAAVEALRVAAKVNPLGYVQPRVEGSVGRAVAFAAPSIFMIDLLGTRLPQAGLSDRNLIAARFKIEESHEATDARPRLRAVRFEGAHLLDSVPACQLLAEEGRALVDISLTAQLRRPNVDRDRTFPLRVAIERNHVLVFTGFGVAPALSGEVHRILTDAVRAELVDGIADGQRLEGLVTKITQRARQEEPVELADMLADEDLV